MSPQHASRQLSTILRGNLGVSISLKSSPTHVVPHHIYLLRVARVTTCLLARCFVDQQDVPQCWLAAALPPGAQGAETAGMWNLSPNWAHSLLICHLPFAIWHFGSRSRPVLLVRPRLSLRTGVVFERGSERSIFTRRITLKHPGSNFHAYYPHVAQPPAAYRSASPPVTSIV